MPHNFQHKFNHYICKPNLQNCPVCSTILSLSDNITVD